MKFPYLKLGPNAKRPIIKLTVSHDGNNVPYFALVDSGADSNIFHADLAPLLGLDLESGERNYVAGVVEGELRPYYVHYVDLEVGGWKHEHVPVGFMEDLSKNGHGVLGQRGFFDLYKVQFDFPKGEIELKPFS